ncbi:beta-hexosaminidase 2-like [Silene latifolia]|uniref:beta-hexosaminidase 2-like n=1 Tax=Silene latifolia TaxID=37657 RepID=UPI003D7805CB
MSATISWLSLLLTLFFSYFIQAQSSSSSLLSHVNVWPKPRKFVWSPPNSAVLSREFTINSNNHRHLAAAVARYQHQIRTDRHVPLLNPPETSFPPSTLLSELKVRVADLTAALQHGVDESYNLTVPTAGPAILEARTPWGAMRGLETFSQLVWCESLHAPCRVAVGVEIWDEPLFGHRGLLLDTSRNYYGVEDILRTIKAMSANKLNVFHWHITDSHSFPLLLPSDPELAIRGSYGPFMQYTPADVARIVEFGFDHGVRVVPEIDAPAHTGSWAGAHPDIVTCADKFWRPAGSDWKDRFASEPGSGQLNPLNPKTYQVFRNVLKDVISLFPDPFYHSGGDEVVPRCWTSDPTIQAYLSKNKTLSDLLEKFVNTTLPYIISQKKTSIYWEDVLLDATIRVQDRSILPPKHTILQTWNGGPTNTKRIVSMGYRAIVSSSDYYYLDCGHGGFVGNDSQYDQPPGTDQGNGGSWCGPFKTWQLIYNYDITYGLTEKEKKLVLGGEVALWSEQADPTVLDSRLWPRASAFAEAMWSGNRDEAGKKRYGEATDRLNQWRYRMVSRGVGAEPIQPLWCARNPGMCNNVQAS